jgi:hypothetical protein
MNWNGQRIIGRHVIDIDGCLRTTDHATIRVADLAALHGALPEKAQFMMEWNGEMTALEDGDTIALDDSRVAFFRSFRAQASLFRAAYEHRVADVQPLAA